MAIIHKKQQQRPLPAGQKKTTDGLDDEVFYVRNKIHTGYMYYDEQQVTVDINKYTIQINNEVESRLWKKIDTTT